MWVEGNAVGEWGSDEGGDKTAVGNIALRGRGAVEKGGGVLPSVQHW